MTTKPRDPVVANTEKSAMMMNNLENKAQKNSNTGSGWQNSTKGWGLKR